MIYFWLLIQFLCGFIGGYMFMELGLKVQDKKPKIIVGIIFGIICVLGTNGSPLNQEEYN